MNYAVSVTRLRSRGYYVLKYKDSQGKMRQVATDIPSRKSNESLARQQAFSLEAKLAIAARTGPVSGVESLSKNAWSTSQKTFISEKKPRQNFLTAVGNLERFSKTQGIHLQTIEDATVDLLSQWLSSLQENYRPATIKGYYAEVRRFINWSIRRYQLNCNQVMVDPRLIHVPPQMRSRGGPMDSAQADKVIAAANDVVACPVERESWQNLMKCMLLTGMRISEGLALTWGTGGRVALDMPGRSVVYLQQKNGLIQRVPLTRSAEEFFGCLDQIEGERVFGTLRDNQPEASTVIGKCGKRSGVLVGPEWSKQSPTAHDFRRSFGEVWSTRVPPAQLRKLMRHSSIETTLTYYAKGDVKTLKDALDAFDD